VFERDEAKFGAPKPLDALAKQQKQKQKQQRPQQRPQQQPQQRPQQQKQQQQEQQKQQQQEQQPHNQQQQQLGFWNWLFSLLGFRRQLTELQGTHVTQDGGAGNSSSSRLKQGPYLHSDTLHPWDSLGKLLEKRQQGQ
jgi:DNA mismatch repair ATPase MutL